MRGQLRHALSGPRGGRLKPSGKLKLAAQSRAKTHVSRGPCAWALDYRNPCSQIVYKFYSSYFVSFRQTVGRSCFGHPVTLHTKWHSEHDLTGRQQARVPAWEPKGRRCRQ